MKQTDLILPFDDLRKYEDTFINGIKQDICRAPAGALQISCSQCQANDVTIEHGGDQPFRESSFFSMRQRLMLRLASMGERR